MSSDPPQRPLFARFPGLRALPYTPLASLPTPIERLKLPDGLGVRAPRGGLYVKRDDLTGELYGGNKVRKLEFLLGDAQAQGKRSIWTIGAIGSHHCLATALYARSLGMDTQVLHFPQPPNPHVLRNLRSLAATGATMRLSQSRTRLPFEIARDSIKRSKDTYTIPSGGTNATGVLGYVNAAFELAEQIKAGVCPAPARIYVACGTGGTFAGLWLGARLAELDVDVIGVRVVDLVFGNEVVAAALIRRTVTLLRAADPSVPAIRCTPADLTVRHTYFGEGYGVPTRRGQRAMEAIGPLGVPLDPTYTAKTLGGLLSELASRGSGLDEPVMFWNTLSGAYPDLELPPPQTLPGDYHIFFEENP